MTAFCPHCHAPLVPGAYSCSKCGSMTRSENDFDRLECENHTGERAIAVCIVCGKPACGDCATQQKGWFFCDNLEHVRLQNAWPVVYSCEFEFEADIIERNLRDAGIETVSFSLQDHVGTYWQSETAVVHVRVEQMQTDLALHRLRELGLLEGLGENNLHH